VIFSYSTITLWVFPDQYIFPLFAHACKSLLNNQYHDTYSSILLSSSNFWRSSMHFLSELECWNIGYSGQNEVLWRMAQAKYTVRPGEQALAQKLRTGPWQYFGGTTTHHSLPLDETSSNYWVSRSRKDLSFENFVFPRIMKTKYFFPKIHKNHQICFCGAVCLTGRSPSHPPR